MALDTNELRVGLLRHNTAYVQEFDHTVYAEIQAAKLRALSDIRKIDDARINVFKGNPFSDVFAQVRFITLRVARIFGFGAKCVGPYEDLPFNMQSNLSVLRYTDKRIDHIIRNKQALQSTPEINIFNTDPTSISLFPGKAFKDRGESRNKYFPDTGEYSRTTGAQRLTELSNKIFRFNIVNLAAPEGINKEIFPAFIESFTESIDVSWSEESIQNRSEGIPFYGQTSRSFTINFVIYATTKEPNTSPKLDMDGYKLVSSSFDPRTANLIMEPITKEDMWKKLNFLSNCTYPVYDENNKFTAAPILKLNLADIFVDQIFIITNLGLTPQPLIWDIDSDDISPMIVKISITGKFFGVDAPGIKNGKLYNFFDVTSDLV